MDPTRKDPMKAPVKAAKKGLRKSEKALVEKAGPKFKTHKAGDPVEFIIGSYPGPVPPCPGSKKFPCSKCGEEVYLAISGQDIVKKGAKPICMECALPGLEEQGEIGIPEINTILADLLGTRKQ